MKADTTYRLIQINQSHLRKGSRCELCGEIKPLQYHEIVSRAMTMNNETARNLSFQKELCALLCEDCHAEAGGKQQELLKKNIQVYGYGEVRHALVVLQEAMKTHLAMELPEEHP